MKPIKDCIYPRNNKCPVCKKALKERTFILNFGVMRKINDNSSEMLDNSNKVLHMSIMYHNSCSVGNGHLDIASWVPSSQADWTFCSSKCFKKFFSNAAAELDKISRKKTTNKS